MLNVGIVGCGLIGKKRALALTSTDKLIACADINQKRSDEFAAEFNCKAFTSWETLLLEPEINAVIVSTTNNMIPVVAEAALKAGKHVLVEKPAGRNPDEVRRLVQLSKETQSQIRVGFNHRFHPGLQRAKSLLNDPKAGPLMYIRARYGHGGRVGYDKEWRANPAISGGGELLDQGVHLIDLCRWLGGEFDLKFRHTATFFWDMPVEDNGFLCLESPDKKKTCWLHASCTEWKNLFDFEIFARDAKIQVSGLGRSYGVEEVRFYQMKPEMGPPELKTESFPGEDNSWNLEWLAFKAEIEGKKTDIATIEDALAAISLATS